MSYLDQKYLSMISHGLASYKVMSTSPLRVNFRCPYCGDSKSSKTKARGWMLTVPMTDKHHFYCHNCRIEGKNFYRFLKDQNAILAKEYLTEVFIDQKQSRKPTTPLKSEPVKVESKVNSLDLRTIESLDKMHPAREYVESRWLPDLSDIYFAPKFKSWILSKKPDAFNDADKVREENRIVIPMYDITGERVIGIVGRSLEPKAALRYITIMFEDHEKIFGLHKMDVSKQVFVLEGPIDAMFVPNSIAVAGLGEIKTRLPDDAIYVVDNEPRNREVVKHIERLIEHGKRVVIWPKQILEKDVNQMILEGEVKQEHLVDFLIKNSYSGLSAKMKLSAWKRC